MWLGLASAWAQPLELQFQTRPATVQLALGQTAVPALGPGHFQVTREQLGTRSKQEKATFRFFAPGWKDQTLQLSWADLSEPLPPVVLEPASLSAWMALYPIPFGAASLGLLMAVLGLARNWKRSHWLSQQESELSQRRAGSQLEDPLLGRVLAGYRVSKLLGGGGMANVYLGLPIPSLDESSAVAIKVIRPEKLDPEFEARFQREIAVCSQLRHPHIVSVLQSGEEAGLKFLVLQYVRGETLDQKLTGEGLPQAKIRTWLPQLVSALQYAHDRGVVHRDLKPSNLMVDEQDQLFLMDFGLARNQDVSTLTATGMALGTPAYVPPEFLMEQKISITPQADQYSLGIMLYEWFTGQRPFVSHNPMKLAFMRLTEAPRPLRALAPDLPKALEDTLLRMLARDPSQRFASLHEAASPIYQSLQWDIHS